MRGKIMIFLLLPVVSLAQNLGGRIRENAKKQVENRIEQRSGEAVDKGMDKVEEKARNGKKKEKKEREAKEPVSPAANSGNSPGGQTNHPDNGHADQGNTEKTDFSVYRGSDFVPGKNVLFFEDFEGTGLGTGPDHWYVYEYDASEEVERPSVKTIAAAAGAWLKMPRKGFVFPNGFTALPEECTIEFDMYADPEKMLEHEGGLTTVLVARDDRDEYSIHWNDKTEVAMDVHPSGYDGSVNFHAKAEYNTVRNNGERTLFDSTCKNTWKTGQVNRVSILRKGTNLWLYLNGKTYMHLPGSLPAGQTYNFMMATNLYGDGVYLTNVRIATQAQNTAAAETGNRFVTTAILFDVNSAHIRPESWAALRQVAQVIKTGNGHYKIVGHTDADGDEQANLLLSQQRAEAVKQALVTEFGISAATLSTEGKGESEPVAANSSPSGKATNRRVELIKQ